jgi:hypothetical protein
MKSFPLLLSGALLIGTALAQAGFVAQPYGDQTINADQSITLPQGGVIRDNKRGFSIDAKFIQYKDNDFLKATTAVIKNNTGQSINAASVDYSVKADRMAVTGPLQYTDKNVSGLTGSKAVVFPDAKKIVAFGVAAGSPVLRANVAVFDTARQEAFLYGNYQFKSRDGKTTGSNAAADATALITYSGDSAKVLRGSAIPAATRSAYMALIERSR